MANIYFVRHGEAEAGFGSHRDPGLSELGKKQAESTAKHLSNLTPIKLFSSPLARAQETALALAELWQTDFQLEDRIAEIPSPIEDLNDRSQWLATVMGGTWQDLSEELQEWRQRLIDCVINQPNDCVMFSHFVAINILVGAANAADEMVSFRPNNASITTFTNTDGLLKVETLGFEANTHIN